MHTLSRSILVLALIACNAPHAEEKAIAAAELFTRQYETQQLHAFVAGTDCLILLIRIDGRGDDDLVESIQYGTGGYDAFGGAEQFAHDRGFRAVIYRDDDGGLWTYGNTSRDEAESLPRCR